jgi:hypothetical protein
MPKKIAGALSGIILAVLAGCSRQEPPKSAAPVPKPRELVATVGFVNGEAKTFSENAWKQTAIGQELEAADSLDLAEGAQVEIRGVDGNVAKLEGPARGLVHELMFASAAPEGSAAGKVLSKVRKLEGKKQTYSVQTPTAVAGIRGVKARATAPDTTKKDSLPQQ